MNAHFFGYPEYHVLVYSHKYCKFQTTTMSLEQLPQTLSVTRERDHGI